MGIVMPDIGTIIWGLIIIGIVFFILKKFAWKPILELLNDREESIEKALAEAEAARKEVKSLQATNAKIIAEGKKERAEILSEARDMKGKIIEDARKEANIAAQKEVEQARNQIQMEKDAAIETIKKQVATLSIEIAENVIRKDLNSQSEQEKIVNEMVDNLNLN